MLGTPIEKLRSINEKEQFKNFKASSIGTGAAQATASAARTAASTASSGMVGGC